MTNDNLAEQLDGARYVETRQDWALVFAWYGGHGVNVYSLETGQELDFFNVGDWETDETTLEDVKQGIRWHIEYLEEEYNA